MTIFRNQTFCVVCKKMSKGQSVTDLTSYICFKLKKIRLQPVTANHKNQ